MAIDPAFDAPFDSKATTIPVLRYLVAVADHGHFGRAAQACAVAQPTLSAQIAQWERRMGVTVFERAPGGVRVTAAGEAVVAEARELLAGLRRLEAAAGNGKPPFFGAVRLGVIPTVGPYLLPLIAPALESSFPDLELPIHEAQTDELLARLDRGAIDVVLLALLPGVEHARVVEPLFDEAFIAALPAANRLAAGTTVAPAELAHERLLLLDEGHCLRDQALELCRLRGEIERPGADYRATSLETLRQLVAAGVGCTVLPALAVAYGGDDPRIAMRPLSLKRSTRTLALVWRASDPRRDAYRSLAPVIRRAVPKGRLRAG